MTRTASGPGAWLPARRFGVGICGLGVWGTATIVGTAVAYAYEASRQVAFYPAGPLVLLLPTLAFYGAFLAPLAWLVAWGLETERPRRSLALAIGWTALLGAAVWVPTYFFRDYHNGCCEEIRAQSARMLPAYVAAAVVAAGAAAGIARGLAASRRTVVAGAVAVGATSLLPGLFLAMGGYVDADSLFAINGLIPGVVAGLAVFSILKGFRFKSQRAVLVAEDA